MNLMRGWVTERYKGSVAAIQPADNPQGLQV
jgi:hypothetical protein